MLKCDKLDHTIGNNLDHHRTIPFIQPPRYPSFGEQHAMQQTLPNVCNGDCELVIKPLPDIKEHLFGHSIQQHLQPGRSTARRSLGLRWALQLLLPAASLEVGSPQPVLPREIWLPNYKPRALAMARAGSDRAPTACQEGQSLSFNLYTRVMWLYVITL